MLSLQCHHGPLVLLLFFVSVGAAQECAFVTEEWEFYNLCTIRDVDFTLEREQQTFVIDPLGSVFQPNTCMDSSVAPTSQAGVLFEDGANCMALGDLSTQDLAVGDGFEGVTASYTGGDNGATLTIDFVCADNSTDFLSFVSSAVDSFHFTITTESACKQDLSWLGRLAKVFGLGLAAITAILVCAPICLCLLLISCAAGCACWFCKDSGSQKQTTFGYVPVGYTTYYSLPDQMAAQAPVYLDPNSNGFYQKV